MNKGWSIIYFIVLIYIPVFYKLNNRISKLEDELKMLKKELEK